MEVAALRFCTSLMTHATVFAAAESNPEDSTWELKREMAHRLLYFASVEHTCQKVLAGSLEEGDTDKKWLKSAAKAAEKDGRHGLAGRLDQVETPAWRVALTEVCKDE